MSFIPDSQLSELQELAFTKQIFRVYRTWTEQTIHCTSFQQVLGATCRAHRSFSASSNLNALWQVCILSSMLSCQWVCLRITANWFAYSLSILAWPPEKLCSLCVVALMLQCRYVFVSTLPVLCKSLLFLARSYYRVTSTKEHPWMTVRIYHGQPVPSNV